MQRVDKEVVGKFSFPKLDVLECQEERQKRFQMALKARRLGNLEKGKVKIYFQGNNERFCVDTTIWDVDANHVVLKYATTLPLRSIYSIDL